MTVVDASQIDMSTLDWDRLRAEISAILRAMQKLSFMIDKEESRRVLLPALAPLAEFMKGVRSDGTVYEGSYVIQTDDVMICVRTPGGEVLTLDASAKGNRCDD
jgi:hypothetical protein